MDDLWDPPYYQETEGAFSFPHVDVIEETEINMKCCIQVLEILISKADEDIIEYEEELMDLLSQLACTDKVFSHMVTMSLKSKIDLLNTSIRKLKSDAESEDFLSTNWEPAESTYDVLKSLFSHYLQKKDLQKCADNIKTASGSNWRVHADNRKKQIGSSSNANKMEKVKTVNIIPVEKETVSRTIVKVKEETMNYHHTIHMPLCWGSTKETSREVRKFMTKSPIMMKKDIITKTTPKCNLIGPKPSLETQGTLKHQLTIVKSQNQTHDKSTSLATVPYQQPSKEPKTIIPFVQSHEQQNAMIIEPHEQPKAKQLIIKVSDYPPGYPSPQPHQNQITLRPKTSYSTRTYKRRNQPNSPPLQTGSYSCRPLVVCNPLDRGEMYSNMYKEDHYTVTDLRAIAKQQNLKGYYKLRKAELAHALGIKLIEGRRKQPKKEETELVPVIKCEP